MKSSHSILRGYILKIPTNKSTEKDKAGRAKKETIYYLSLFILSCITPRQPKWKLPFTAGHLSQSRHRWRPWSRKTKQRAATGSWTYTFQEMLVHPYTIRVRADIRTGSTGLTFFLAAAVLLPTLTQRGQRWGQHQPHSALSYVPPTCPTSDSRAVLCVSLGWVKSESRQVNTVLAHGTWGIRKNEQGS